VRVDDQLQDAGVDSLALVELRNALRREIGPSVPLEQSLFADFPTVGGLAGHIAEQLAKAPVQAAPAAGANLSMQGAVGGTVGVTGMACRLAGVRSPEALWDALVAEECRVTQSPPARWAEACEEWDAPQGVRCGSFIEDIEHFDAGHFKMSDKEADGMDPHMRLMLEVASEALRDAPTLPEKVGTFTATSAVAFSIPTHSFNLARLVAKKLGLVGPCHHFDVACTSSHSAIHAARESLLRGECDAAVVVGCLLQLVPPMGMSLLEDGVLSASGFSRPLDTSSDGIVFGEACASIVLQRDPVSSQVHAYLRGSSTTQSSVAATSLLAPDVEAQEQAIHDALSSASISPSQISLLHIHGEGQQVADTSEMHAVRNVLAASNDSGITLLNHKANFGHSVSASGIVAVITTIQAMKHRSVPRHLGVEHPMKCVKDAVGLTLPFKAAQALPAGEYVAAVHGHAISGINAHLILASSTPSGERANRTSTATGHSLGAPAEWSHSRQYSTRAMFSPRR